MGYLPVEEHHHPAILSLVVPATPAVKLLDPFAGDGLWGLVAIQLGRRVTALVRNDIQHDGLQIAAADRCLFASDQIKSGEVPVSNTELDSDDDW